MLKVGISGAKGSFSEEAGREYMTKQGHSDYEITYLISVEGVLTALDAGEVDLGIFPIENSNGGIVYEAIHAMSKHIFDIKKIFEIDVHHALLVTPGMTADSITEITSHDQAIKQCRMYLKRKWPSIDAKEYPDTAKAAKDLREGTLPKTTAVIAPAVCSDLYGLEILEESIQDLKFNFTTFLAVMK